MTAQGKPLVSLSIGRRLDRRQFIAGAGTTAFLFSTMKPELIRGATVNSKIALGVIGCGERGTWITDLFQKHGGYEIVAAADYFPDKVGAFGVKFNVSADRRYSGLLGYRAILEGKLDAVAIESPPYFHPQHQGGASLSVAASSWKSLRSCLSQAHSGMMPHH